MSRWWTTFQCRGHVPTVDIHTTGQYDPFWNRHRAIWVVHSKHSGCDNDRLIFIQGAIFHVPLREVKGRQVYLHASTSDMFAWTVCPKVSCCARRSTVLLENLLNKDYICYLVGKGCIQIKIAWQALKVHLLSIDNGPVELSWLILFLM